MNAKDLKGEADYDFKHDILFFKTKNREYKKSIELENFTLDIDEEGFITGIQIFEASKFLNLDKVALMKIPKWKFMAKYFDGRIDVRLIFQVRIRNIIVEKNPIILESISEPLPNSELECVAT